MAGVQLVGVTREAGGVTVLDGVDLRVDEGEVLTLIGPSGSGKTALLRLVAGLDAPTSGQVLVGDRPVDRRALWENQVAMVFQEDALYRHMDVGGNVSFPLLLAGLRRGEARRQARGRLGLPGVQDLWERIPAGLSDGERALVATGRALVREGVRVLLLDEPLARADRALRSRFREEVRRLHGETGLTVMVATNDPEEAMAVGHRLAVLERGRILQVDTPSEVYRRPASTVVAGLVGPAPMNLLPASPEQDELGWWLRVGGDRVRVATSPPGLADGRPVLLGIHPADLFPAPPGTPFSRVIHVTVGRVETLGHRSLVRFGLGSVGSAGFAFLAAEAVPGRPVELTWPEGRERLFDAETGRALAQ